MTIQVFYRGQTVPVWCYNRDWEGTDASPDQGVKVTLTNPKAVVKVDNQAMSEDAEGNFVYYYASLAADEKGWWSGKCVGQDGTGAGAKIVIKTCGFELK